MKQFRLIKIKNNRNKNEVLLTYKEFLEAFTSTVADEYVIEKENYNDFLNNIQDYIGEDEDIETAKQDFVNYWNSVGREILEGEDYIKALVEHTTWTSPRGIEPETELLEII